ncbi:MAG: F0F1 ATP synthase subunit beta, partial [Kiritimatiellae bacterium]|nr:F0F1 ATP synthase subunit beta [Kiritimatiellia bacterium]
MSEQVAPVEGEEKVKGRVVAVQGPVVDVKFKVIEDMPDMHEMVMTKTFDGRELMLLVAEHLEGNLARCVAMSSTLNLQRNTVATAMGESLSIPVGDELFGRIINVMGQPLDGKGPIKIDKMVPIHKDISRVEMNVSQLSSSKSEIVETGIKAVDLLFPVVQGSKTGIIGGAG